MSDVSATPAVLARRALAEFVGTAFRVAAVVGSGIAATRLSPHDVGLELLENSVVTGAVLVALILTLQPVSAAFNPVVTLVERALGAVSTGQAGALISAQIGGGVAGALVANLMFGLPAVTISAHHRAGAGIWLGEVVATLGLLVVIFGTVRSGRADRVAYAVGLYILAAYWFTSSTSFANPAVTIARMFSDTFAGIAPASAVMFVAMQLAGGVLGCGLIRLLYPNAVAVAARVAAGSDPAAAGSDPAAAGPAGEDAAGRDTAGCETAGHDRSGHDAAGGVPTDAHSRSGS
jgi:arsenate reductase